jgi:PIN domain nuclease of toxin-antitoxin system
MSAADSPLLLDTHIWVWLSLGTSSVFGPAVQKRLEAAGYTQPLHVSIMSAWEVAILAAKGRLNLAMPTQAWIEQSLSHPAMRLVAFDDPAIAVESNELPGNFHADPVDRLLVATARISNFTLVTRDQKILDYGKEGYVSVLAA